jgi:carbamoyltransferase
MFHLAVFSGHNASITIAKDDVILESIDLERLMNVKNMGWTRFFPSVHRPSCVAHELSRYFNKKYGATNYETIICNQEDVDMWKHHGGIKEVFKAKNLVEIWHQDGHAYNTFYQTDLQSSVAITFDGGGNDGCFNFYRLNRKDGITYKKLQLEHNLGEKYAQFGFACKSIHPAIDPGQGYLTYSGKLMGLAAYGEVMYDKLDIFRDYYTGHHGTYELRLENFKKLNLPEKIDGKLEADCVRTSQYIFEELFMRESKEYIDEAISMGHICLGGGCALNVLNNTALNKIVKTYVSPQPEDRGLSLGFMLGFLRPSTAFDSTYIGPEAWDRDALYEYVNQYKGTPVDINELASDLRDGKIIGIIRGRSEYGARALGNRSIICIPKEGMKDVLNIKVKNREYFRPYAPMVRYEDVDKYFDWSGEARWMNFCPTVKHEWRAHLPTITHADGTARIQTVKRDQNDFIYDLLTEVEQKTGVGVLVNTSFNIAGKPMINTYRDAVYMLENTEMDGLILENYYIKKNK